MCASQSVCKAPFLNKCPINQKSVFLTKYFYCKGNYRQSGLKNKINGLFISAHTFAKHGALTLL